MNILDTNGLDYMVKQKITAHRAFFITPDIQDEFEAWHEQRLPKAIQNVFETDWFDKALYLQHYKEMLNKYGGRSFYNMTGFGDISVLALLKTQKAPHTEMLIPETIDVVSSDGGLANKIRREFGNASGTFGGSITITDPVAFFAKI